MEFKTRRGRCDPRRRLRPLASKEGALTTCRWFRIPGSAGCGRRSGDARPQTRRTIPIRAGAHRAAVAASRSMWKRGQTLLPVPESGTGSKSNPTCSGRSPRMPTTRRYWCACRNNWRDRNLRESGDPGLIGYHSMCGPESTTVIQVAVTSDITNVKYLIRLRALFIAFSIRAGRVCALRWAGP